MGDKKAPADGAAKGRAPLWVFLPGVDPSPEALFRRAEDERERALVGGAATAPFAVPARFTPGDPWPAASPLLCWGCGLGFEGPPFPAPAAVYDPVSTDLADGGGAPRRTVAVAGNWCSPYCVRRDIDSRVADAAARRAALGALCEAYRLYRGERVGDIPPAPPRTARRAFGGPLSDAEFRAAVAALRPAPAPVAPPAAPPPPPAAYPPGVGRLLGWPERAAVRDDDWL